MSTNQPRKPAGTPVGGQWAPMAHAEPSVQLRSTSESVLRMRAANPAKSLERITERLHFVEEELARVQHDETLLPGARAAVATVYRRRLRGLRAAYTKAFRQLAGR